MKQHLDVAQRGKSITIKTGFGIDVRIEPEGVQVTRNHAQKGRCVYHLTSDVVAVKFGNGKRKPKVSVDRYLE